MLARTQTLVGHEGPVNEIRTHPMKPQLVISASKVYMHLLAFSFFFFGTDVHFIWIED